MSTLKRVSLTILVAMAISIVTISVAYAATTYVDEFSSQFTGSSLLTLNPCSFCNNNKGKYRLTTDGAGSGRWNSTFDDTITWWYVYIPNDTSRTLGGVWYTIWNTEHQPPQIPVIQNNWKGQYVSLGWLDVGDDAYAKMRNNCTGLGDCSNRIYWDIAKYTH